MHLEAVAHAQCHRARINPPLMPPEAVAVPEAVRHQPLTSGCQQRLQAAPTCLAVQIRSQRIAGAGAAVTPAAAQAAAVGPYEKESLRPPLKSGARLMFASLDPVADTFDDFLSLLRPDR